MELLLLEGLLAYDRVFVGEFGSFVPNFLLAFQNAMTEGASPCGGDHPFLVDRANGGGRTTSSLQFSR